MTQPDFTVIMGEPARLVVQGESGHLSVAFPGPSGPVGPQGAQGAQGAQGPVGPQGPAGGNPFIFNQNNPLATWTIPHMLGRKPTAVFVEDSAGTEVYGSVSNPDINTTVISFSTPFSGTARLI